MIKVYAKLDNHNVITEINSSIFLDNVEDYICIDEGNGDKYAHAQGNYLEKPLIDFQGRYNYKILEDQLVELTEEEKEKLFPSPTSQITDQKKLNAQLLQSNAQQQLINASLVKQIAEWKGFK